MHCSPFLSFCMPYTDNDARTIKLLEEFGVIVRSPPCFDVLLICVLLNLLYTSDAKNIVVVYAVAST